jgi:deoxyadenosine/deoxycytidine kinase
MKLTKDNIQQWKEELSNQMKQKYGLDNFSETTDDDSWLDTYSGCTVEYAIETEMFYSAQN